MKNIRFLSIIFLLFAIFLPIYAHGDININVNLQDTNYLKDKYGLSNFYNCQSGECKNYCTTKNDSLENNRILKYCYSCTQSCLERQQLNKEFIENITSKQAATKCISGYELYNGNCVKICQANSTRVNGLCVCNDGYIAFYLNKDNYCATYDENCSFYDQNTYGDKSGCHCKSGYELNSNKDHCVLISNSLGSAATFKTTNYIIGEEKKLTTKIDNVLSKRMSGNILLQVEQNGEGWYVNPDDQKKYYLGRPADAFNIMRNFGLGIKHSILTSYLNSKFPDNLSGKILLDVEQNGEAYYVNPKDLRGYFLNRPADAYKVMRELGLGITNSDIRKINVGEINDKK